MQALTVEDMRDFIEKRVAETSASAVAAYFGVSRSLLSRFLCGHQGVPEEVLKKLQLVRQMVYVPIAQAGTAVESEVLRQHPGNY